MDITIQHVHFVPEEPNIQPGILYVSREFGTTSHQCPCGCGEVICCPLDPEHGWVLSETDGRASLLPSIGNFNIRCKSHYYIRNGRIVWLH